MAALSVWSLKQQTLTFCDYELNNQNREMADYKDLELHVQMKAASDFVEINYRDDGKLHPMERSLSEPLEKTLIRIGRNFQKKEKKKKRSSSGGKKSVQQESCSSPESVLLSRADGGLAYDLAELTNRHWETGMRVFINDHLTLTVVLNPPIITSVGIFPKKFARVNNFLVPEVSHEFSSGVHYAWHAKSDECSEYHLVSEEDIFSPPAQLVGYYLKLYCTPFRVEVNGDPLSSLSADPVTVLGRTVVHYLNKQLLAETSLPKALECRRQFISRPTDETALSPLNFRLVSFNILASGYAQSSYALSTLYDYIDNQEMHLSDEYRLQLVARELLAYRGDIICLQEVDESAYHKYLNPIFTKVGYVSHHTTKSGSTPEGCASFVSSAKFDLLGNVDISLRDVIKSQSTSSSYYLQNLFHHKPAVFDILTRKITTIGQISILRVKADPRRVCLVVNTHLFFHPDASYIRLLQIHEIVHQMEQIKSSILSCNESANSDVSLREFLSTLTAGDGDAEGSDGKTIELSDHEIKMDEMEMMQSAAPDIIGSAEERCVGKCKEWPSSEGDGDGGGGGGGGEIDVSCLVFGDLNSTPETGAIHYLERGYVNESHTSWDSVDVFSWGSNSTGGGDTKSISSSTTSVPVPVPVSVVTESPHGVIIPSLSHSLRLKSAAGYPLYSNYTKEFKALLDYIFVEENKFDVVAVGPQPTEEVLSENCAIPSAVFPSDHLSIVVDVAFVQT